MKAGWFTSGKKAFQRSLKLLLMLWLLSLSACSLKSQKVFITASSWNSDADAEPKKLSYEFDLKKGEIYETLCGTLKVLSIGQDKITIETSLLYVEAYDDPPSGLTPAAIFEIPIEKQQHLVSESEDGGCYLIIQWQSE
ncbi:MAG: hypothetical protein LBR25_00660 [Erysipelotrichaceae bacterium]|jgi:hypothetical protein|nr:hypothetical protein [Erysipelotrichaceae bacterium]